ncbi:hypothetical protein AURDEDRAFT_165110 [Auricularia subglabra TFB-10046 SS5]|nr:hypothetical protein AURDEDRAFT_165110 [Auricularia subglabra TFB-10046 SS5]
MRAFATFTLLALAAAPALAQLESFPGIADPSSESKPRITFTLPTVPINPPPTITRTLSAPTSVTESSTVTAPVTEPTSSTSQPGSSSTTPEPVATQPPPNVGVALAPAGPFLLFFAAASLLAYI